MKTSKKQSIYETAAKLFGEKGFEGTSLDEVAEKAGVAKGTIFYHFQSKEELFSALIKEGIEVLSQDIARINSKNVGIDKKLNLLIECHFDFFKKHRDMCLMLLGQMGYFQTRWQKSVKIIRDSYISNMEKIIAQAKEEGVIDKSLDTESLIISFFSVFVVTSIDWTIFHPKLPQKQMTATIKTMLKSGIIKQ